MIPLALRLTISGGREAVIRLVILAVAVGLGVGLLLTAVAATNAAVTWNNRHAWFWTGTSSVVPHTAAAREHGTTVILVTHDARVAAYADREVVVRDGKVSTLTGAEP